LTIDSKLRKALLQPGSVALVGASPDLKKNSSRPQRFLKQFGYAGPRIADQPVTR
jgi:predicted CoA-binding protein